MMKFLFQAILFESHLPSKLVRGQTVSKKRPHIRLSSPQGVCVGEQGNEIQNAVSNVTVKINIPNET